MRIDLIVDGTTYIAEPYLGQTECIDCALGELCDNIYVQPCQMYKSKVIFKKNTNNVLSEMSETPCKEDIIKITHKLRDDIDLNVGDGVLVTNVRRRGNEIHLNVRKEGGSRERITSNDCKWVIIRDNGERLH